MLVLLATPEEKWVAFFSGTWVQIPRGPLCLERKLRKEEVRGEEERHLRVAVCNGRSTFPCAVGA